MTVSLFSGEFDDTEIDGWEQTREVSDIFVHPDYNNHDIDYDFTLIKLAEPVELNDHVAPACFPSEEDDLASTFPPGYHFLTIFLLERGRVGDSFFNILFGITQKVLI